MVMGTPLPCAAVVGGAVSVKERSRWYYFLAGNTSGEFPAIFIAASTLQHTQQQSKIQTTTMDNGHEPW